MIATKNPKFNQCIETRGKSTLTPRAVASWHGLKGVGQLTP